MSSTRAFTISIAVGSFLLLLTTLQTTTLKALASPGIYTYHSCQVYNASAAVGDTIANAIIGSPSPAPTDPNSSSVISNASFSFANTNTSVDVIVNLATNPPSLKTVGTVSGGHSPPISSGSFGGGSGAQVPWVGGVYKIQGSNTGVCSGDCHAVTLNTDTCYVYQGGGWSYNALVTPSLKAYNGFVDNLSEAYVDQGSPWFENKCDNWSNGGIPGLGWTDFGEDAALASINHPLQVILPVASVATGSLQTNYSPPTVGRDGMCGTDLTKCFEYGDTLRYPRSLTLDP